MINHTCLGDGTPQALSVFRLRQTAAKKSTNSRKQNPRTGMCTNIRGVVYSDAARLVSYLVVVGWVRVIVWWRIETNLISELQEDHIPPHHLKK